MKKRILITMLAMACLLVLSACGCTHEWKNASCLAPKTCTLCEATEGEPLGHSWVEVSCAAPKTCAACGETEGEALPHTWEEATCAAPKTCSVCGGTEGEALPHTWVDANYHNPKTCSVCGGTEGEPLVSDFVTHGLDAYLIEENVEYDYHTACYTDETRETVGKLMVSNFRIFESDETHEAKEGYEWRAVDVAILFNDENAWNYGMSVGMCQENFDNIVLWDDSTVEIDEVFREYTANYNGTEYPCVLGWENGGFEDWDRENKSTTYHVTFCVQVPVGYDRVVAGFYDHAKEHMWLEEGTHIYDVADENTLFFRMG